GIVCGFILWIALEFCVSVWGEGAAAAVTSAGSLLASAETFSVGLVGLARMLEISANQEPVDRRRRVVVFIGLTGGALVVASGGLARMLAFNTEQATVEPGQHVADAAAGANAEATPSAARVSSGSSVSTSVTIPAGV